MAISSNTLFQFTKSIDTLEAILKSKGFWPRYCIEFGWKQEFAVPMCCFCDTPLAAIKPHMDFYGHYGIGMSKEWAIKKGISPVMYHIKESKMATNIRKIVNGIGKDDKETSYKQIALMKLYKGVNYRKDKNGDYQQKKDYLYYDEREWRYIPELENYKDLVVKVNDREEFERNRVVNLNAQTLNKLCAFSADDIKYLFVEDEIDTLLLCTTIDELDFTNNEKEQLKTKIIPYCLIKEDI